MHQNGNVWVNRPSFVSLRLSGSHRLGDIFQVLRSHVFKGAVELPANLALRVIGNADAAGWSYSFQSGRDIHTVAEDVIVVEHDVADVNADAKLDPGLLGHVDVFERDPSLHLHRAAGGVHGAGELDQHRQVHDPFRIYESTP